MFHMLENKIIGTRIEIVVQYENVEKLLKYNTFIKMNKETKSKYNIINFVLEHNKK